MLYTERQVELDHCQWQNPIKQVLAVRNSRNQFSSYETAIKQAWFEGIGCIPWGLYEFLLSFCFLGEPEKLMLECSAQHKILQLCKNHFSSTEDALWKMPTESERECVCERERKMMWISNH